MSLTQSAVLDALRNVYDPDLHKDLVTLDMVKDVKLCGADVLVQVELTTPACPMKDRIRGDIEREVKKISGVERVNVEFSAQVRPTGALFPGQQALPGVKNVIAIGAGKGGVGKSTVATLLAYGLAAEGCQVGLMDADVYGPSLPKMLGVERADVMVTQQQMLVPVDRGGIKVMSVGFLVPGDKAMVWRGPMAHGIIKQFLEQVEWGELDYLVVDLPPGTGDIPLTLAQTIPVTGAVVVCTPQDVALSDAVRALRMYEALKIDILGIVENMSFFIAPDTGKKYDLFGEGGAARAAAALRVPFLGSLPINIQIRISGDEGTPEKLFDGQHPDVKEAVQQVVGHLVSQVSRKTQLQAEGPVVTVS